MRAPLFFPFIDGVEDLLVFFLIAVLVVMIDLVLEMLKLKIFWQFSSSSSSSPFGQNINCKLNFVEKCLSVSDET